MTWAKRLAEVWNGPGLLTPAAGRALQRIGGSGPISDHFRSLLEMVGENTYSGRIVSADTALRIATVFRCVNVIAETMAALPFGLFKRSGEQHEVREHLRNDPLNSLVHFSPNPYRTASELRSSMIAHALLRGNGYARIIPDRAGRARELYFLNSAHVTPIQASPVGRLYYEVREPNSRPEVLEHDQVWHIPGMSWDGVKGISVLTAAREAMGLASRAEEHGARFYDQGGRPSGVLQHPGVFRPEKRDAFQKHWEATYSGAQNAGRTAILEEGMTYNAVSMSHEDAQFIETRQFSVIELCRFFGVPPHMVFAHESQPRANMEQSSLEFVVYTLGPWLAKTEATARLRLLPRRDQAEKYFEHNVEGLLRGDFKSRMEGYIQGRNGGWLSVNDIRTKENMNPVPGGDVYLQPLNMGELGGPLKADDAPDSPPPEPLPTTQQAPPISERLLSMTKAAAERMDRRELGGVRKLCERCAAEGLEDGELEAFYSDHCDLLVEALALPEELASEYCSARLAALREALIHGTSEQLLDRWTDSIGENLTEVSLHASA